MDQDTEIGIAVEPARRHRSKQLRRQIAEESLQPGTSAAIVARRHEVNANQVFQWRKQLREGRLDNTTGATQLMPVRITDDGPGAVHRQSGNIQIEVGTVRIRVEGAPDPNTLRAILEQFSR